MVLPYLAEVLGRVDRRQHPLIAHHHPHHAHHPHIQQTFQFAPPDQGVRYDDGHYDTYGKRLTSSRSSSSSEKSVPRKRSYTTLAPLTTSVDESAYDMGDNPPSAIYEVDMSYGSMDADGSPIDGSNSGGEQEDVQMKTIDGQVAMITTKSATETKITMPFTLPECDLSLTNAQ